MRSVIGTEDSRDHQRTYLTYSYMLVVVPLTMRLVKRSGLLVSCYQEWHGKVSSQCPSATSAKEAATAKNEAVPFMMMNYALTC